MSTIYIVTSGDYSGYGIEAVFSTEELAKAYISQRHDSFISAKPGIEEYELDVHAPKEDEPMPWYVTIREDGSVIKAFRASKIDITPRWITYKGTTCQFYGGMLAHDEAHAVKIMAEKKAQSVAAGELDAFKKKHGLE